MNKIETTSSFRCQNDKDKCNSQLMNMPIRFKGIILKSVYDKQRLKQVQCMRNAVYRWYIQKRDNQLIKDSIDRLLIAEGMSNYRQIRFFYRMKNLIRKQKSKQMIQQQKQLIQQQKRIQEQKSVYKQQKSVYKQQQLIKQGKQYEQQSQIIQYKDINKGHRKNYTQYFESLKNIFSLRLIQCGNELSDNQLNDNNNQAHIKQNKQNNKYNYKQNNKHNNINKGLRYKTQGCQLNINNNQISYQQYQCNQNKFSQSNHLLNNNNNINNLIYNPINNQSNYKSNNQSNQSKQLQIKLLSNKVAFTLIKSFIININNKHQLISFINIYQHSQSIKINLNNHIKLNCLKQLQLIANQSSQSQSLHHSLNIININHINQSHINLNSIQSHINLNSSRINSNSFIQSQISSSTTIPPINYINTQINQVQYSLSLLSNTIYKNQQIQQLYIQFHSQFKQFEVIQKDFQILKIKTKNTIFDRIINIQNKISLYLKTQAFKSLRLSNFVRKHNKSHTQILSKSRVNIRTLHQVFSKKLILPQQLADKQEKLLNSSQQHSVTSIKLVCDRNAKTDINIDKLPIRGGIKKQTLKSCKNIVKDGIQKQFMSSFGQNLFKQKPTNCTQEEGVSSIQNMKSRVNFNVFDSKQQNNDSQSIKKSEQQKQNQFNEQQCFKRKSVINNNLINEQVGIFYDMSIKTLQSNESSGSCKYHAQIKSQYWWNDIQYKQNIKNKEQKYKIIDSKQSIDNKNQY